MTSRPTRTELVTHDGLRVYDLVPLAVDLWAVAGPDGVDPATIDPDALPDGCRWLDDDEWPRLNAASGATYAGLHDEIKARETTLTNMPGNLRYTVLPQGDGWGFRCLEPGSETFDAIIAHETYPTPEAAEAAAREEAAGFVALERKQAAAELGGRIGAAMARDVIADAMPREWTGLDPQDADQIPANLADLIDEIEYTARSSYREIIDAAR